MTTTAPPAPPGVVSHKTYASYFADEAKDPHRGTYGPLMREFRVEDNPPTPAELHAMTTAADPSHAVAYLMLSGEGLDLHMQVIHSISRYPAIVGRRTPWDGRAYASFGDVVGNMITTIEFADDAFEVAHGGVAQNVPRDFVRARELLEQNPEASLVGPFNDADAQITTVTTRKYVPLPHRYVRLLLGRRVPLREGFITLSTTMETHGDDTTCGTLKNWLLTAITRATPGGSPSLVTTSPVAPLADQDLLGHRQKVLHTHLTGLSEPTSLDEAGRLNNLVSELVHEQRMTREDATRRSNVAAAPKTVAKALGAEVATTLLALCQVGTETDLPKFWIDVAQAGKRDRQALEQALYAKAREFDSAEMTPVATPDLVKRITGLQWHGLSLDDLGEGIQPFSIVLPEYMAGTAGIDAQKLADAYDIMASTATTSTLGDAQAVKAGKAIVPLDYSEARAHLVALTMLWSVLLGDTHPFVMALASFLQAYTAREYTYQNRLRGLGTAAPAPALLLRYVQLRMVVYWRKAITTRALPRSPPNFEEVLEKLEIEDKSWIPELPHKYWKPLQKPHSSLASVVSGITLPTIAPSSVGDFSNGSGTPSVATRGSATSERPKQVQNKKPQISECFAPYGDKIKAMTIKDAITKGGQPPTVTRNGSTTPMCISYHLKGECWSGCSRNSDHCNHTAEEDSQLVNWCQAAYGASA